MALHLYMDVHVAKAITTGLRARGVRVLTAQEDGTRRLDDTSLLARATKLGYVLFTNDTDFKREAAQHQRAGIPFAGIIYAHQTESVGLCIEDLALMAEALDMPDMANTLRHLPL